MTRVFERDVAPQVVAVGDVVDVAQDLGLGRVLLGPLPLLLELGVERVRVEVALHVAARARVAVPEPGAADAVAGLHDAGLEPELAQQMQLVKPGEACAHDECVDAAGIRHGPTPLLVVARMLEA